MEPHSTVQLTLKADDALLPVATAFVEQSALAFGLGKQESLALTLATEEVFLYLAQTSTPATELEIRCQFTGYGLETAFLFEGDGFPLRAFNLTATPSFEDEAAPRETGLIIASRLLDGFQVEFLGPRIRLTLIQDKVYPEPESREPPLCAPLSQYTVRHPDLEELKASVRLVRHCCRNRLIPLMADFPGKVADIFAAGRLHAALAVDTAGHMGGVLFWTRPRGEIVDCYGPYIFHPDSDPEMAALLLDRCLEEIARSGAAGLINRYPGTLPSGYFEAIGSLDVLAEDGTWLEVQASYRQLGEDKGATVWGHPDLVPFLEAQYERLTLPREIRCVTFEGERRDAFSVLSAEMDPPRHWAVLRPVVFAEDAEKVLADHVKLLHTEGFQVVFFEMHIENAWKAHFTPALFKNGFEPRFVLPDGRRGDMVMFQYRPLNKA